MALLLHNIIHYLNSSRTIVLATVNQDNQPDLRTIGGYNFDGYILYFATKKTSRKTEQLLHNDSVVFLVQHENQVLPNFTNVTIYGKARQLSGPEYELGRAIILERRPNAIYEESTDNIYQIVPEQIKILDLSKKVNEQVQIIRP